jgi:hypothetical protein
VTPSAVRDALKAKLDITGLRSYDTIPEHIVPPAAVVGNLSIDWDLVMKRGADTANLDVTVITGRMSDRAAQDFLDSTKIEADQTLNGTVTSVRCLRASPLAVTVSGVDMLAYRFEVVCYG